MKTETKKYLGVLALFIVAILGIAALSGCLNYATLAEGEGFYYFAGGISFVIYAILVADKATKFFKGLKK